jgi:hypothetical protein
MNDSIEQRKTKERSPSFPFIPLEAAIERARQLYAQEKRGSAPFSVTAKHWRFSPSSSGALQTAAALKNYGLLADEGSGATRKLKLTDLALRILLDARPDDADRKRFMRQAALTPNVAADIYNKWPNGLPSEATLNHYLVLDLGFSQSTAIRTVKIIHVNELFTKYDGQESLSEYHENGQSTHEPSYPMEQQQIIPPMTSSAHLEGTKSNLVRTERLIDPDGLDILLQFNGEPTVASYEFLNDYTNLRIKGLRRTDATTKKDNTEPSKT